MPWWAWLLTGMGVALLAGVGLFAWAYHLVDEVLAQEERRDEYL